MLTRLGKVHWAGTREYLQLSKALFSLSDMTLGVLGLSDGDALNASPGEIEGINEFILFLAYYPHCFATFLYSHVFLYINILKIFCRSLFIKVIFSRPQLFLK